MTFRRMATILSVVTSRNKTIPNKMAGIIVPSYK